ncbi:hypothetical protein DI041_06190 [Stenotrophomonas maltophilia]|nr:hypothetical protein EGJ89_16740 [Stenotrophomonas maltophilia]TIE17826.1 hypothetical protein DI034_09740 [Stenotrophomonas maltophilia]TIE63171.1 hypothetical protein DI041_06190 [Stenotrophomonas maltophilia]HDS1826527.1 hypothetical protein [Stenotrophomonas maltophilia]
MRFFNRSLLVYELGLLVVFILVAFFITRFNPVETLRLGGWLFLLMQPILLGAHAVDHFSRKRRR